MAFLTINGTAYDVLSGGAVQQETYVHGRSIRAFDGTERHVTNTNKRRWRFSLRPMTQAAQETLRALVANFVTLTLNGTFNNNNAVSARVKLLEVGYLQTGTVDTAFRRTPEIEIEEV